MPRSRRRKGSEDRFRPSRAEEGVSQRRGPIRLNDRDIGNFRSSVSYFDNPSRPRYASDLAQRASLSRPQRTGTVEGFFSPLKSSGPIVSNLPKCALSLTDKRVSSRMITASLIQEETDASEFLSISEGKGRLIRRKQATALLGRKTESDSEGGSRLLYAQRLLLFKTLLKKPLPFLEVHGRFGVSKSTMTSLVKNGFLIEMWGPKAVGVRLKLSNKGKAYLKELEAASKYEPKMRKNAIIQLKRSTML